MGGPFYTISQMLTIFMLALTTIGAELPFVCDARSSPMIAYNGVISLSGDRLLGAAELSSDDVSLRDFLDSTELSNGDASVREEVQRLMVLLAAIISAWMGLWKIVWGSLEELNLI